MTPVQATELIQAINGIHDELIVLTVVFVLAAVFGLLRS